MTVTGITASDKVYDGTTAHARYHDGQRWSGVVGSDDVTLDTTDATGTFDTKDAGTGKTVTVTGLALTGTDAGNYTADHSRRRRRTSRRRVDGDGHHGEQQGVRRHHRGHARHQRAVLVGVVAGDDVTLNASGATGTFASKDVGTGKTVTVSRLALAGADAGNYTLTQPTTTANITAGDADGHRHHARQQGLRRHHRRDAQHHERPAGRGGRRAMT